jgi:hypothetical protein
MRTGSIASREGVMCESAFPYRGWEWEDEERHKFFRPGMSLRDYFASRAMLGIITSDQWKQVVINEAVTKDKSIFRVITKAAYELADAMLEERERQ